MTLTEIQSQFRASSSWEERYRLLIQLSRQLPKPSAQVLETLPEIHGCESRLWFKFCVQPREMVAYSDARLMQGLLMIIRTVLLEKSPEELAQFDIQALFDGLQITRHLTSTRLNGLKQLQEAVRQASKSPECDPQSRKMANL